MSDAPSLDWDCGQEFYVAWLRQRNLPFCEGAPRSLEFARLFSNSSDQYLEHFGIRREDLPTSSCNDQEQYILAHLLNRFGTHDKVDTAIIDYSKKNAASALVHNHFIEEFASKQDIWTTQEILFLTTKIRRIWQKMDSDNRSDFLAAIVEDIKQSITSSKEESVKFGKHYIANAEDVYTAILRDVWIPGAKEMYRDFLEKLQLYDLTGEAATQRDEIASTMRKSIDLLERGIAAHAGMTTSGSYMGLA